MILDLLLELLVDVGAAAVGLILDASDQVEPLLKLLLVVALALTLQLNHNVLEFVHQDREEGDTEDLDDATEDLFHD